MEKSNLPSGFELHHGYFELDAQLDLIEKIREIINVAPLFQPTMPKSGKPFSIQMSNCGELGWVADKTGYRYQELHPVTNKPWPEIPTILFELWDKLTKYPSKPQACLINYYSKATKLGLHRDEDEEDFNAPVLSVSLGDDCLFRVGGENRKDPTSSLRLLSGDVVVLGGKARLCYHGVDRIYYGTSTLLKNGGRINLTLRRVSN